VRRSVLLSGAVAVVVALVVIAIVYALLVIPFYALARFAEPGQGLDRPFIRDGILRFALPAGILLGAACGAAVGVWHARGGRLPAE
jgi:hypothetical protein